MIITNDKNYIQSRFGNGGTQGVPGNPEDMVASISTDAINGFSFTTESSSVHDYPTGNQAGMIDSTVQGFLTNAKTYANDFATDIKYLSGSAGNDSSFVSKTSTSDSTAVSVKSTLASSTTGAMNIKVDQLASNQINKGNSLAALSNSFGSASEKEFQINIGGANYNFAFSTTESDNNLSILQKMAKTINALKIGVSAELKYNGSTEETSLTLVSNKVGATADGSDIFTVKDLSGNAAATAGITTTTDKAKNAIYRLNDGDAKQSDTNTITQNGVTLQLNKTTEGNVKIETSKQFSDSDLVDQTKALVNSYNKLFGSVNATRSPDRLLEGLTNQFSSIVKDNAAALQKIGITQNSSGELEFNEYRAQDEDLVNALKSFFDKSYENKNSFTSKLLDLSTKIQDNPTKFVEDINLQGVMGQTYNSPGTDAYNSFREMQIQFKGVLLDLYK